MKKAEIKVGGKYTAKVNNRLVTVRVDSIRKTKKFAGTSYSGTSIYKDTTIYDVTNLSTGRTTTFRSAAKFRREVKSRHETNPVPPCDNLFPGGTYGCTRPKDHSGLCNGDNPDTNHHFTGEPKPTQEAITELVETDTLAKTLVEDEAKEGDKLPNPEGGFGVLADFYARKQEGEQSADFTESIVQSVDQRHSVLMDIQTLPSCSSNLIGDLSPANYANASLAGKIALTRQQREVGTPVAGMIPNEEQESIIAAATKTGLRVMVVGAGAGTGKTATLKMLEQVLLGKGQYTAFNASLVAESKSKFTKAACNTTHSLAFREVGKLYAHRLGGERVKSYQIAQALGIESLNIVLKGMGEPDIEGKPTDKLKVLQADFLAGQVMVAIKKFCQSADREVEAKHLSFIAGIDVPNSRNNVGIVHDYLLPFCRKAWADMSNVNGTLPFTHDCYVKLWQLGEGDDRPVIAADYILLDECQDTAPVFLDIIKQQTHALICLVGDENQSIYEWRGAVNAMKAFPDAPKRVLSQSYRFGQAVADVANTVLATLDEPTDLVMRGMPTIPSRVDVVAEPRCYLYRTNAGAVSRVMSSIKEGKKPHLIGGGDDVVKWCQAALDLQSKRGTRHPELCCFESWAEVVEYSKTDEGSDMRLMVKLVTEFGAAAIRDVLRDMPKEEDADLVVSTAHKSKGREWNTVKLGPDFPTANKMSDPDRRLLYVAATRAKLVLDISQCPPFCGGRECNEDGEGGGWVPGLEIKYTQPMPSAQEAIIPPNTTVGESIPSIHNDAIPANVAEGNGNRNGIPTDIFTWAKGFDGKWNVRGPKDAKVGDKIKVIKKSGAASYETVREVIKRRDDEAWIYRV